MTKPLLLLVGISLMMVIGTLLATGQSKVAIAHEDMKYLQGEWSIVAAEYDGGEAGNLISKHNLRKVIIQEDKVKIIVELEGGKTEDECEWSFAIYPFKKPKQFGFRFEGKMNWLTAARLKEPFKGIYSLDKDMLRVCSVWPNANRSQPAELPKDFSAKKGSRQMLLTLQRVKR